MNDITIKHTLEQNLCISCGVCAGVCPVNCIEMKLSDEGDAYRPVIDKERCIQCGKCKKVCPGLGWQVFEADTTKEITNWGGKGKVLATYNAWAKESRILQSSVSGGMITVFVKELLDKKFYEKAFLVDSYEISKKIESKPMEAGFEYEKTGGSRYTPVSHEAAVRYMREHREEKLIFVGVACALNGILKVIQEEKLNRDKYLLLGLFCDKTLNRHVFTYFDYNMEGNLKELCYRSKKDGGWPGKVRLVSEDGKEKFLPAKRRMEIKEYMQMRRCLYCFDKLNESCDIAFGDNYTKKDTNPEGSNSIIIRTPKGKQAFEAVREKCEVREVSYEDIYEAQNMKKRNQQLEFAQLLRNEQDVLIYPEWGENSYPLSKDAKKAYEIRQNKLKLGQEFEKNPEAFFEHRKKEEVLKEKKARKENTLRRFKVIKKIIKLPGKIAGVMKYALELNKEKYDRKFILVTGGEWNNKGAQAMLFVTMTELSKRLPEYELCAVVPEELIEKTEDLDNFKFRVLPEVVCREPVYYTIGGKWLWTALKRRENMKYMLYANKIWKNTAYVFDISGYAMGTKWGKKRTMRSAMLGAVAKKVGAKSYLLPQSFGPFEFKMDEKEKKNYNKVMKKWLSNMELICAREPIGKQMLEEAYGIDNVVYMQDIVLQNKEYDLSSIYKNIPNIRTMDIRERSVGLIPNKHLLKMKENNCYEIWEEIIRQLLKKEYRVYLLVHAEKDIEVIKTLKSKFEDNDNVILVQEEYSCIEYDNLVPKFDFLVASRYHSIVHAFRRSVPCIVLGWADKYEVLLEDMNQLPYMFDMRKKISVDDICRMLSEMEKNRDENAKIIGEKVKKIQEECIFDKLSL